MDEIEDMLETILRQFHGRYPLDVTDQVFLAIEQNENFRRRYDQFADGDYATTNKMIGRFVEEYTGLHVKGRNDHPKSSLIKSYSILGR